MSCTACSRCRPSLAVRVSRNSRAFTRLCTTCTAFSTYQGGGKEKDNANSSERSEKHVALKNSPSKRRSGRVSCADPRKHWANLAHARLSRQEQGVQLAARRTALCDVSSDSKRCSRRPLRALGYVLRCHVSQHRNAQQRRGRFALSAVDVTPRVTHAADCSLKGWQADARRACAPKLAACVLAGLPDETLTQLAARATARPGASLPVLTGGPA